jgi:hypothetical protein
VSDGLPPDCALALFDAAAGARAGRETDMLVACLCRAGAAGTHDSALAERLLRVADRAALFANPFSALQDLEAAGFHRSCAALASSLQLWTLAVCEAALVEAHLAKRYIHRAPRKLRAELCRAANIEFGREDGEAVRIATKEAVCAELLTMTEELEQLTRQSEQSAQFLKELEEWGAGKARGERACGGCRRPLVRTVGYRFPCGHLFHEKCLVRIARETLSLEDTDLLDGLLAKPRPAKPEVEQHEALVAGDCPLCGERAAGRIRRPVVPPDSCQWSFALAEPGGQKAGSLRRIFGNRP